MEATPNSEGSKVQLTEEQRAQKRELKKLEKTKRWEEKRAF